MGIVSKTLSGAELRRRLPKAIWRRLGDLFRQARRMALLKGFFVVLTIALLCLLGLMAVDALITIFSQAVRLALSAGALAVIGGAVWWWMVRPALRRMDLTSMARLVEHRHPELEETVSSAVQFLASEEPEAIRGSSELIGEVVKSAERDVRKLSPRREFNARAARPWLLTALAILSLLVLLGVMWPKPTVRLIVRAVAPFHDTGNAFADTLEVTPGDVRVAAGSDVTIEAGIRHPRLKRATVRRREAEDQPEGVERMNLVAKGDDGITRFSLVLPAVQKDFTYRVHAGNAVSRSFQVHVVVPPKVEELSVRYEYPEYTGLVPREEVWKNGEIVALEHTKLRWRARVSEPVPEAILKLDTDQPPATAMPSAQPEWEWQLGSQIDQRWEIHLRDGDGFASEPVAGQVRSVPDQVPELKLVSPEARELRLRPSEYLPLAYQAREDFGFSRAELIVRLDGKEAPVLLPAELPQSLGAQNWEGKAGLALGNLDLTQVSRLTVQLRVADNRPLEWGGGQEALSELVAIRLERGAKPLVEQVLESQEQEIRREMERARNELQSAKVRGEEAAKAFSRQDSVNGLSRLEESRRASSEAGQRLEDLAARMQETAYGERAKQIREIASGPVQQARERAESAPLTDRAEDRDRQLREMGEKLNEALQRMTGVLADLQKSRDEARRVAEVARLAQEQQRLAQQAKREMLATETAKALEKPVNPAAPEAPNMTAQALAAWKREQEQLQRQLGELLRKDPEAMKEAMAAQAREAAAMVKEAQQLKGEQNKLEAMTGKAEQADAAPAAEQVRRELMNELRKEQEAIERDARSLRDSLRKQYPAAADAHEQLAQAAVQAQKAAKEMGRNAVQPAHQAADQAKSELQTAAREAREELAKAAIREQAKQALDGAAAQAGKLSQPMDKALEGLARDLAEKLVETPWPAGQRLSLEQKLGETVDAVRQAMAQSPVTPPTAPASDKGAQAAAAAEDLARAVQQKGEETLQRWGDAAPAAQRPLSPRAPVPADPEAVANLGHLAERQDSLTRALDALDRGQLGEALAARQQKVAEGTARLSEDAEKLQKMTGANPQAQARAQADQAKGQLAQAERQALTAARDLARAQGAQDATDPARQGAAQPAPLTESQKNALKSSRQAQQRTGEALEQAAQKLDAARESLAAGAKAAAPDSNRQASPRLVDAKDLARSYSQMSQAMQATDAQAAAQQASRAAEDLRQMAWKMAERMGNLENWTESVLPSGQEGQPAQASGSRDKAAQAGGTGSLRSTPPGEQVRGDGVPPEMLKWGVSAEDWAKVKGALDANVAEGQRAGMPAEYRGLVGDYFRALAEQARTNAEKK